MDEKNPVNNINENIDDLKSKPQSPNTIKIPEKIKQGDKSIPNRKENSKKIIKLYESNKSFDDVEHPEPLFSDCNEQSFEEIKNNFYENKKKESLSVVEKKKILKSNYSQIMQQKLKIEKDSLQLKENIGKVVLNCKFVNDKNLDKNYSQKNSLIKPEKVINNFMLEQSSKINKTQNLSKCEIINNNNQTSNIMKKNNSLKCIKNNKKQKLIKHNHKNQSQHQMGQIIKIPIDLKKKKPQTKTLINNISQLNSNMPMKSDQKESIKLITNSSNKLMNKNIPLKKIIKIVPVKAIATIEINKNKSTQNSVKKINHNYINKIQNENVTKNKNNSLNKIVIINKNNSINKNNIENKNKRNTSFENPKHVIKKLSPTNLKNNIRRSNELTLNNDKINQIKKIPLPFKVNNCNISNNQFHTILNNTINIYNCPTSANSSINNDLKLNSINKNNDSYMESEKENYPSNSKFDICNKKTIHRGGKFNNVSTTYVILKNTSPRLKYPKPSLTLDTKHKQQSKQLVPNLSTITLQQYPPNSPFELNPIYPQLNPGKSIKMNKSQNYIIKGKENIDANFQNSINSYISNYPLNGRNGINIVNKKKNYYLQNKEINKPNIYKCNYTDNFWNNESLYSYFNTSGYLY